MEEPVSITVHIPPGIPLGEHTDPERELLMLAAVKAYELGRLSSGQAARLAGLSRVEFLKALSGYEVFPFQAELEELEQRDGADECGGR